MTQANNFTISTTLTTTSIATETVIVDTATVSVEQALNKRSVATPKALAAYPEDAISSGCSKAATLPAIETIAETITLTSIETIAITAITTAHETEVSIFTELATSTITSISPAYTEVACGDQAYGAVWGGSSDGFNLYCGGYTTLGTWIGTAHLSDMASCLRLCQSRACSGVSYIPAQNACSMYVGKLKLMAFSGFNAALRVQ